MVGMGLIIISGGASLALVAATMAGVGGIGLTCGGGASTALIGVEETKL